MSGAVLRGCVGAALLAVATAVAGPAFGAKPAKAVAPTNLVLAIDASTPRGTWKMRVTNRGDAPETLAADARLLALDVTPRGSRRPVHCSLPADMRPTDELERLLLVPPSRSYAERFEPRLYCLGHLDALAPGAIVVATLAANGHVMRSEPIALPDEPVPTFDPKGAPAASPYPEPALSLHAPSQVDAYDWANVEIPLTLTNKGTRAAVVRFRPETVGFEVVGPAGVEHCAWPSLVSNPTLEAFDRVAPGGHTSMTVVLTAYCAGRTFAQPGLYVVRASLDTRRASGAEIGLRSFDGQVIQVEPTVVRLHRGSKERPLARPQLQPQ